MSFFTSFSLYFLFCINLSPIYVPPCLHPFLSMYLLMYVCLYVGLFSDLGSGKIYHPSKPWYKTAADAWPPILGSTKPSYNPKLTYNLHTLHFYRSPLSKGKAKISSVNRLNCVTDLLTRRNTRYLLSLYTSCSSNCLSSQSLLRITDCETWLEVKIWFETQFEGWDTAWAKTWNK